MRWQLGCLMTIINRTMGRVEDHRNIHASPVNMDAVKVITHFRVFEKLAGLRGSLSSHSIYSDHQTKELNKHSFFNRHT